MKSQRFIFSIVAVAAILGALFVCFGIVKPQFQSAIRGVSNVKVAEVMGVVEVPELVAVSYAVAAEVSVLDADTVDHPVSVVDIPV